MEMKSLDNKLIDDISFFLKKEVININNTEHIIDILNRSNGEIKNKLLIAEVTTFINYFKTFYNILPKGYHNDIIILKTYFENNYQSWIIDQIENDINININGKLIKYKDIIHNIEFFIDFDLNNINSESYEKLTFAIKVISLYFESHHFLEKNEQESISNLNQYIENPTINDSKNILILLKNIKETLTNTKEVPKEIIDTEIDVKEEVIEKLELFLPNVINNLYIKFSKLFNKRRDIIDKGEIIIIQKIVSASNKSLQNNKKIYGELILEQFENFKIEINKLDIENIKEFKEEYIKEYFEDLIIILKEISHIYKKQK